MSLEHSQIPYGSINLEAHRNTQTGGHFLHGRIPLRYLLDFGVVASGDRQGRTLQNQQIDHPCIIKSLHAPSQNDTNDTIVMEIHHKEGVGVQERFFLQYYSQNHMPMHYPELIVFPENVIYVNPGQASRVMIILEPVNVLNVSQPDTEAPSRGL